MQHTYNIGGHVYTLHVTRGPIFRGTEERSGEAIWNDRVLLISGTVNADRRKEVLVHEAIEAWNFHFPKPEDHEKLCDWNANVHLQVAKDFERNGGQAALDALQPDFDVPPPPGTLTPEREQQLRAYRFPELSDENYQLARLLAESRGLNPWSEQFYVKTFTHPQRRLPTFKIVMNIEGLRLRAHRTGVYAGIDEIEHEYGDDALQPVKSVAHVYRFVNGERCRFTGEALWAEYYDRPADQLDDVVRLFPSVCLGRCAEAAALRRAFTEETKDIHVPEEFAGQLRRAAKPMPRSAPFVAGAADALAELDIGEVPQSSNGLHMRLMDLGMKDEKSRRKFIAEASLDFGERRDGDDVSFYRFVITKALQLPKPPTQP